jgi:excisionase family DNA binding protein
MAIVAEKVLYTLDVLKSEMYSSLQRIVMFVSTIERDYFLPGLIDCTFINEIGDLVKHTQVVIDELSKWVLFDADLQEYIRQMENAVDMWTDRFLKWSQRKPISVSEAVDIFHRSRSTIYRWIKKGKLNARKSGRYWVIAV